MIGSTTHFPLRNAPVQVAPASGIALEELLPKHQAWFTIQEIAVLLGKSDTFIRGLIESKCLMAHVIEKGLRKHYRIPRRNLLLFLVETATYDPSMFLDRLMSVVKGCNLEQRLALQKALAANGG